jgi:hypothetical protein
LVGHKGRVTREAKLRVENHESGLWFILIYFFWLYYSKCFNLIPIVKIYLFVKLFFIKLRNTISFYQ